MSRAFVKETDGDQIGDELPERPQSRYPNYVTPNGLAGLQAQLHELQEQRRRLAEHSDELLNKETLKHVERDLRYVQERVDRAILIDPAGQPADEVSFGATVKTVDENDNERDFTIVGEDEADVPAGKISWVSPLARAMMGAAVGDTVVWKRPAGDMELEILSIRYADPAHKV
ncbi:GreA/GreB family elongation factor [Rhodospirillaceae bacterium SYSU D60014]|uniref:GreA/GreB family elongation factor n=1 Tax=Virgifigura deserti TaxID=2268457 RepID=UPI000E672D3F